MTRAVQLVRSPLLVRPVQTAREAGSDPGTLDIVPAGAVDPETLAPGILDARWGKSSAQCVERAVAAAKNGEVAGIVSAPLNKETFHMAGYTAMDDMTFFQECFAAGEAYQVGEVAGLWTTPVTFHVPFRQIPDLITRERVLAKIRALHHVMVAVQVRPLKIAVAALNVHAGGGDGREGGSTSSLRHPAAEAEGLEVVGPVPADSLFPLPRGELRGWSACTTTRPTSPEDHRARVPGVSLFVCQSRRHRPHGTAYDIAWRARPGTPCWLAPSPWRRR
jgi:4-hydroxythreonine-4-phosphate dehydrogenase